MATEWVTVRNPMSGNTARVPRSAVALMPKWKEVKQPTATKPKKKRSTRRRTEPSANPTSGETSPEESASGEESTDAVQPIRSELD